MIRTYGLEFLSLPNDPKKIFCDFAINVTPAEGKILKSILFRQICGNSCSHKFPQICRNSILCVPIEKIMGFIIGD